MLDRLLPSIFKAPPPKLCGQDTDTFCYLSIKDRHPVTITKIIDQAYKLGVQSTEQSQDTKDVTAGLSRLKNRLQTDKELETIGGTEDDVQIWNKGLKNLNPNTWFSAPWLSIECYMYRKIHEMFQQTATLTYPDYDVFREEKCQGLLDSLSNMAVIARLLIDITSPNRADLENFTKLSLWGNKTDLSLLEHFNLELADVQDTDVDKDNDMILCNHLDKLVTYIQSLENAKVDIVLDNAGYELFGDLCLAELLLRTTHVSQIRLHMKALPWFVSDVTEYDLQYMLNTLTAHKEDALRELGEGWRRRRNDETILTSQHSFWTTQYGFSEMRAVAPDLYKELATSDLIIFKGDLNYRKLVNDRSWDYDTDFVAALEGFKPTKVCALRTIKSDAIVSCDMEHVENILKDNRNKLFCGSYAVISCNF